MEQIYIQWNYGLLGQKWVHQDLRDLHMYTLIRQSENEIDFLTFGEWRGRLLRNDTVVNLPRVPDLLFSLPAASANQTSTPRLWAKGGFRSWRWGFVAEVIVDRQWGGTGAGLAVLTGGAYISARATFKRWFVVGV